MEGEKDPLKSEEPSTSEPSLISERESKPPYPRGVVFILFHKLWDSFGIFVVYTMLTIYLISELDFDENRSQRIFHTFMFLVTGTTIIGGIISDAWLGKFWTIIVFSILYTMGEICLFCGTLPASISSMRALSLCGLFVIAVANGALKPCSSAFGGDQFDISQAKERKQYFSFFFIFMFLSHILASFMSPILKNHVECFGKDTCYPLVFGIPVMMNLVGIATFVLGKPFYTINPIREKIFVSTLRCTGYALKKAITNKSEKKEHWLNYAEDKFDSCLISDIKTLFHVLQIYIPIPFFFTLFHQTASTWVLQASSMDREVLGYFITPEQMLLLFPTMVIVFIPIFDFGFYPLFNKLGILKTHLQKIGAGGVLCGLSFIMAGIVQLYIEGNNSIPSKVGFNELTIINNSPCQINVTHVNYTLLKAFRTKTIKDLPTGKEITSYITSYNCSATEMPKKTFKLETQFELMMITLDNNMLTVLKQNDTKIKLKNGNPRIRLFFRTDFEFRIDDENSSFVIRGMSALYKIVPDFDTRPSKMGATQYNEVKPGTYQIYLSANDREEQPLGERKFKTGGSYLVEIYQNLSKNQTKLTVFPTVRWNSVPILLQLPQYITITAASIMYMVTGMAFSYSEAPLTMKAVVQAIWYLNYAIGNAYFLILQSFIYLLKTSNRLFAYGTFMLLDMGIFFIIAHYYTYISDEDKRR